MLSVECETGKPDIGKVFGKLTTAKEVSNAVHLAVPRYVYKEWEGMLWANLKPSGIGLLVVEPETRKIEQCIEAKVDYSPKRKWDELHSKLLEYYPASREHIEKALGKITSRY